MDTTATPTVESRKRKPGRPMKIGRIIYDPNIGHLAVFAGRCNDCNTVVTITREEAADFAQQYAKERDSYFMRLVNHLAKIRTI